VSALDRQREFTARGAKFPREGTLLPETYKFPRGRTRDQVIQRMQQAKKARAGGNPGMAQPAVPLTCRSTGDAGLGHRKETAGRDASRVGGVRQPPPARSSCSRIPRISYVTGLVGGKGTLGGPIKRSIRTVALQYLWDRGLPPGPIANPGRASHEAAANPALTRDPVLSWPHGNRRARLYRKPTTIPQKRRQAAHDGKAIQNDKTVGRLITRPRRPAASVPLPTGSDGDHTQKPVATKKPARRGAPSGAAQSIHHHPRAAGGAAMTRT